jgi:triosephosphate isomerase
MNNPLSDNVEIAIAASTFCIALIFQHIMIRHLPILDFRPYKIGNNIAALMEYPPDAPRDEYKTQLIYKNSITGEVKEFDSDDYPWNDSTWVWQDTKSVLIKQGYVPPVHDFTMTDTSGIDYTEQVLNYEKPVLLVVMHKLEKSEVEGLQMLRKLQDYAQKNDYAIIGMTSSNWDVVNNVKGEFDVQFPFVQTDDITLKTIVRANPGIVKLEKGTVIDKWNYRDFKFK